jgi:two-component system nitrogen regulation response regulator GlnG
LQQLSQFSFPGNVRQLENICHWLTVMAPAQVIEPKDLPPEVLGAAPDYSKSSMGPDSVVPAKPMVRAEAAADHDASMGVAAEGVATSASLEHGGGPQAWEAGLEIEAQALLATGRSDVWDVLTRRFESKLIQTALLNTRGRRIEAAQKLGIGRNTITRKIQELNLE